MVGKEAFTWSLDVRKEAHGVAGPIREAGQKTKLACRKRQGERTIGKRSWNLEEAGPEGCIFPT